MVGRLSGICPGKWPFFGSSSSDNEQSCLSPAYYLYCLAIDNAQWWLSGANYPCAMTLQHSLGCPVAHFSQGHTLQAQVQGPGGGWHGGRGGDLGLRSQPAHFASTAPLSLLPPQSIEMRRPVPTPHTFSLLSSYLLFSKGETVFWMSYQTDQMLHRLDSSLSFSFSFRHF